MEMLAYVAILAFFSMFTVQVLLGMTGALAETRQNRALAANGSAAIQRLSRDIQNADAIIAEESVFGQNPGTLALLRADAGESIYRLSSGAVEVSEDGATKAVTGSGVSIVSLQFDRITTEGSEGVRISMTLQSGEKTEQFFTTVMLRN